MPPDRQSIRLRQRQSLLPAEPALGGHLQDLPEGGVEKTYNEIFALPPGGTSGLTAGRLPESRAYAAVVATGGACSCSQRKRRRHARGLALVCAGREVGRKWNPAPCCRSVFKSGRRRARWLDLSRGWLPTRSTARGHLSGFSFLSCPMLRWLAHAAHLARPGSRSGGDCRCQRHDLSVQGLDDRNFISAAAAGMIPKVSRTRPWTHHRLLTADPNAEVKAQFEIEALFPDGASDQTKSAVSLP